MKFAKGDKVVCIKADAIPKAMPQLTAFAVYTVEEFLSAKDEHDCDRVVLVEFEKNGYNATYFRHANRRNFRSIDDR